MGGEGITRGMDARVLATKFKYTTLWNAVPEHTPTDRDTLYVQIHTLNHIHKTNTQQTFIHKHATLENMPHTHTHSPTLKQNTHTKTNTHTYTHLQKEKRKKEKYIQFITTNLLKLNKIKIMLKCQSAWQY